MDLKICPECGSLNVKWVIPQIWSLCVCQDCKYRGPIISGDAELAAKIRKEYLEKIRNNEENLSTYDNNDEEEFDEEELSDEELDEKLKDLGL